MVNLFNIRSDFNRNVLTLMTGTTVAQAIPIAISPILTRIYSPNDFGVFALFISISSIFGSIASAQYESALMLPERDEDAFNVAVLGVLIAIGLSCILFLIVLLCKTKIVQMLGNDEIGLWLYLIPISVLFTGFYQVLNYFNIRSKSYKDIAKANIYKSLVLAVVQITVGLIKPSAAGLIIGSVVSKISANIKLLKNVLTSIDIKNTFSFRKMKEMAIRYQRFPRYSLWSVLTSALSNDLRQVLMPLLYSMNSLGLYALGQRVLGIPALLVGQSMGQVFFQAATQEKIKTGNARKTFNSTASKLLVIGLPIFGLLFFIIEDLFSIVFGEDWRVAGRYAKILLPVYFVRFYASTTSTIYYVFEKNKIELLWQLSLLVLVLLTFFIAKMYKYDFEEFLILLSCLLTVDYLIYFAIGIYISRGYTKA